MNPDLETRVAIVETRQNIFEENVNEIYDVVQEVKERLDKQNGILPHISDEVKDLSSKLNEYIAESNTAKGVTAFSHKLLWAIMGGMGTAVLALVVKIISDSVSF